MIFDIISFKEASLNFLKYNLHEKCGNVWLSLMRWWSMVRRIASDFVCLLAVAIELQSPSEEQLNCAMILAQ